MRENGTERLEQAVSACSAVLEEATRDRVPLQWAMAQITLGDALRTLGERESNTARLEEAVGAYDAALTILVPAQADYYVGICRFNRDKALAQLSARKG